MIYGWGTKTKDWTMPDGRQLVCQYNYVSLMFIIKLVWKRKWLLITRDRAMDTETNRAELERLYGQGNVPDIGLFERFGAFMAIGAVVVAAVVVAGVQSLTGGTTIEAGPADNSIDGAVAEVVDTPADDSVDDAGDTDDTDDDASDDRSIDSVVGSDDADTDDGTTDDGTTDEDSADEDSADEAAPPAAGLYEEAADIASVGASSFASTNINMPFQGWSATAVDRVYATTGEVDGQTPDGGQKFVVVEYQLVGQGATANVQDPAFRLYADDRQYSPFGPTINYTIAGGEVANSFMYFSVPLEDTELRLEMGIVDPAADGYQSAYAFTLATTTPPAPLERYAGPDLTGGAVLTSESDLMSGTPGQLNPNWSPVGIDVLGATLTAKVGPDGARPGFRFLLLEVEMTSDGQYGLVDSGAFRVEADGELYGLVGQRVNLNLDTGQQATATLAFEVPVWADQMEFRAGVPETFETGERATFDIVFE